jgi:hypothetical protein
MAALMPAAPVTALDVVPVAVVALMPAAVVGPLFEQSHSTKASVITSQTFVPSMPFAHMQLVPGSHSSSSSSCSCSASGVQVVEAPPQPLRTSTLHVRNLAIDLRRRATLTPWVGGDCVPPHIKLNAGAKLHVGGMWT